MAISNLLIQRRIFLLIILLLFCNIIFVQSSMQVQSIDQSFIDAKPAKVFSDSSSIQCIHKCKLAGYLWINFYATENNGEGLCHCFADYVEESVRQNKDWKIIMLQKTPARFNEQHRLVDGGFTSWTQWTSCSKTCGNGLQQRMRTCTNPTPTIVGIDCKGTSEETRACKHQECTINGGFSAWSVWTTCTKTCGSGTQQRTRSCTNPTPMYGGSDCQGAKTESRSCNDQSCPTKCTFKQGNGRDASGNSSNDFSPGPANTPAECVTKCVAEKAKNAAVNGAVYAVSNFRCYCEKNMVARDSSPSFRSCLFGE